MQSAGPENKKPVLWEEHRFPGQRGVPLFRERERNRHDVVRLALDGLEPPRPDLVTDFRIELAYTGRRTHDGELNDRTARSNRELQGNLTLESRIGLQVLVVGMTQTRGVLPDHAENGLRGTLAAFLTHVDIRS